MKKSSILLLFTIGLFLLACEADTETQLVDSADSIVNIDDNSEATLNLNKPGDNPEGTPPSQQAFLLHKDMAWAAYTTSMVLHESGNALIRSYFINAIASGDDEFSLDDLLGSNPSDGGLFKNAFKNEFGNILCAFSNNSNGCPGNGINQPPPPPVVVIGGGFDLLDISNLVDQFIVKLIVDNCLDLYFPNGLNYGIGNNVVTSVAHPLNSNPGNWGVKRIDKYTTSYVFVNPAYAGQVGSNVVVVRPQGFGPIGCDYTSYGINFDDFLD